jgi:hypothetical protein
MRSRLSQMFTSTLCGNGRISLSPSADERRSEQGARANVRDCHAPFEKDYHGKGVRDVAIRVMCRIPPTEKMSKLTRLSNPSDKTEGIEIAPVNPTDDLIWGAYSGNVRLISSALKRGASPNARHRGRPALLWAIQEGKLNATKALVRAGASLERKDDLGFSPVGTSRWRRRLGHSKVPP